MEVKDAVATLKDWFFDLAGLFLPGAALLFLVGLIVNNLFTLSTISLHYSQKVELNVAFALAAYIVGYVIYGVSESINLIYSFKDRLKAAILTSSKEVALFKELLAAKGESFPSFTNHANFEELRNFAMSISPESDSKIYTFTFRADICNQLGTACFIAAIGALVKAFMGQPSVMFCTVNLAAACLLKMTNLQFLDITYRVPFSIANAKLLAGK